MRLAPVIFAIALVSAFSLPAMDASSATPPGQAATGVANTGQGVSFGTAYCKPTFPCGSLSNFESQKMIIAQAISIGTSCVSRELGNFGNNLFETSFGLDSSLCLKTKKMPKNETGLTMAPRCCVKPVAGSPNTCQVVCTKYGTK